MKNRYIVSNRKQDIKPYGGTPNSEHGRTITTAEVSEAIQDLPTKYAQGQDGITKNILRNLDEDCVEPQAQ